MQANEAMCIIANVLLELQLSSGTCPLIHPNCFRSRSRYLFYRNITLTLTVTLSEKQFGRINGQVPVVKQTAAADVCRKLHASASDYDYYDYYNFRHFRSTLTAFVIDCHWVM